MIGVKQLSKPILGYCSLHTQEQIPLKWKLNQDISPPPPFWWALFQIMACRLFGPKPLPKPMMTYCQVNWTLRNKLQWNSNQNTKFFVHENAFENIVSEIGAILYRGRWVNIFFGGYDISMFILVIIRIGCSHSICDFDSLAHMLRQNGRRFAHDNFKRLSLIKNEVNIFMWTSLKFIQVRVCQHWFK